MSSGIPETSPMITSAVTSRRGSNRLPVRNSVRSASPRIRAFSVATRTDSSEMSLPYARPAPSFAATKLRIPLPQPMSTTVSPGRMSSESASARLMCVGRNTVGVSESVKGPARPFQSNVSVWEVTSPALYRVRGDAVEGRLSEPVGVRDQDVDDEPIQQQIDQQERGALDQVDDRKDRPDHGQRQPERAPLLPEVQHLPSRPHRGDGHDQADQPGEHDRASADRERLDEPDETEDAGGHQQHGRGHHQRWLLGRACVGTPRHVRLPSIGHRRRRHPTNEGGAGQAPTRWTFRRLACVRPAGEEATITTCPPVSTNPAERRPASIEAIIPSVSSGASMDIGRTPWNSVMRPTVRWSGENAAIGTPGRAADSSLAVSPVRVKHATASARPRRASTAAAVASGSSSSSSASGSRTTGRNSAPAVSAARRIRAAVPAASTGKAPMAVSPESMTTSAPSNTAPATSPASARVGRGEDIIDSSSWVATTTGIAALLARLTNRFWYTGISSRAISTPRSPRATMTPSAARMIAAASSTAGLVSIFATMIGLGSAIRLARARTSKAPRTNDWASMSTSAWTAHARSSSSFGVMAGIDRRSEGTFTPALERTVPPRTTSVATWPRAASTTRGSTAPSASRTRSPGFSSPANPG